MPTYKLGPASGTGKPPVFRRRLICEQCAEALGNVDSLAVLQGLSATLVAAMWPDMGDAVDRHEQSCPSKKS